MASSSKCFSNIFFSLLQSGTVVAEMKEPELTKVLSITPREGLNTALYVFPTAKTFFLFLLGFLAHSIEFFPNPLQA